MQGGYLRGKVTLPESFVDAEDAHLDISLVYGLDDMRDINENNITPCLLYVKGYTILCKCNSWSVNFSFWSSTVNGKCGSRRAFGNSEWMISFRKSAGGVDGFLGDGTTIPRGEVEKALSSGVQVLSSFCRICTRGLLGQEQIYETMEVLERETNLWNNGSVGTGITLLTRHYVRGKSSTKVQGD